ncbi:palmitoyl-acyl carrier protein thioesterase, chloroplastic-like [Euphorbia lathyris]|uniref:palmitoyl-acyl carrier protein thioesterase, chloroplastic-like n=1 Tax=Euphorbia lathyris TaxID=212925 RepID=UPI00331312DD
MATASSCLRFNKHFQRRENIKNDTPKFSKVLCKKKKNFSCKAALIMEEKEIQFAKSNDFNFGRLVENGLIYSQNLTIRSSEIGFDGKASIATLITFLQDSAVNHVRITGTMAENHVLGITQEMCRKDLIWVLSSLQIVVDQYPSWSDVVEVETWMYPSGKNGIGHDWIIRDRNTRHVVAQATSQFVLMNKKTRRLSKFNDKIRQELAPHMMEYCTPILNNSIQKLPQLDANTADFSSTELKPGWNDLDVNQHVNNVKYINWILESVPRPLMKHHRLCAMKLKYQKECNMDSVLHSLSKIITSNENEVELEHLLLLENGQQIVRGNTIWKPINDIAYRF